MVANLDKNAFKMPMVTVTGSKTFSVSDANTIQDCANTSSATFTIPLNSVVPISLGSQIIIKRRSTLPIAIDRAVGVDIYNETGTILGPPVLIENGCELYKVADNIWQLVKTIPTNAQLLGNPTTTTQAINNNSTRLATTAYTNTSNRPYLECNVPSSTRAFPSLSWTIMPYAVVTDTDGIFNAATGVITIPAGMGGLYLISGNILLTTSVRSLVMGICGTTAGSEQFRITQETTGSVDEVVAATGTIMTNLVAGQSYTIQSYNRNGPGSDVLLNTAISYFNTLRVARLNI